MPPMAGLQLIWPERLDALREQQRAHAHARRRQRCFGAGMAAAYDDDSEIPWEPHEREATGKRAAILIHC